MTTAAVEYPRTITHRGCVYYFVSASGSNVYFMPHSSFIAPPNTASRVVYDCPPAMWLAGTPWAKE